MIIGQILGNKVILGQTENGFVYKNQIEFDKKSNEICYIPEHGLYSETGDYSDELNENTNVFRYQDFVDLAKKHIEYYNLDIDCLELAENLFDCVDWQFPSTLLDEWGDEF